MDSLFTHYTLLHTMKPVKKRQFGLLALLLMAAPFWGTPVPAAQFEQAEVSNPDNFIVLAAPAGRIGYGLLIIEQVKNDRPCWNEVATETGLTIVDPLLTQFDFTGICGRSNDSNAYSVRTDGEDLGLQYSLRVLRQGNDLVLVAASNRQRNLNIPIGRTYGVPQPGEFARIQLDPGWRLSRRTFEGRSTGHVYLTNDQPISVLVAAAASPTATAGPIQPPSLPNPQVPSNSSLLPAPGSTSPLTESPAQPPAPSGTAQPGTSAAPVQIPVPSPATPSRATLPPLPNRPAAGTPVPPAPAPPANTTATSPSLPNPPGTATTRPAPLPNPPASTGGTPTVPNSSGTAALGTAATETTATGTTPAPLPPAPSTSVPSTSAPSTSAPQPEQRQATGIIFGYRVIVAADSAELQDRVRSLAPQTQIVTINGQPAVQAGLFRDLNSAEQLRQRLAGENLSVTIVPIR